MLFTESLNFTGTQGAVPKLELASTSMILIVAIGLAAWRKTSPVTGSVTVRTPFHEIHVIHLHAIVLASVDDYAVASPAESCRLQAKRRRPLTARR
jgi:hypothetical protein